MTREEFAKKWTSGLVEGMTEFNAEIEFLEDLDSLLNQGTSCTPLPPAEGAVNFDDIYELLGRGIDKIMRGESSLGALADEAEAFINSEVKKRLAQPQPTAEGAEEILTNHIDKESMDSLSVNVWPDMLEAMNEFAILHAQRLADKMVSERLREELIKFDKYMGTVLTLNSHEKNVDAYLKTRESHE